MNVQQTRRINLSPNTSPRPSLLNNTAVVCILPRWIAVRQPLHLGLCLQHYQISVFDKHGVCHLQEVRCITRSTRRWSLHKLLLLARTSVLDPIRRLRGLFVERVQWWYLQTTSSGSYNGHAGSPHSYIFETVADHFTGPWIS